MSEISLTVRYYRFDFEEGQAWREENMRDVETTWRLKGEEAALVLVDCWDRHYLESHLERTNDIVREHIAPVIKACHEAGITVVHAPSPDEAKRYPRWLAYAGDEELFPPAASADDWPPSEFRDRSGEYQEFAKPPSQAVAKWSEEHRELMRIAPEIEPGEGEFVVATGGQLHRLLKDRKILHLFYAGFAANMCVPYRDYGVRAMRNRGYNIILLRDCTTGIEAYDTLPSFALTRAAILDVEMNLGFSTTAEALTEACQAAGG